MANEVELKLRIAAPDILRLKRHPAIKAAMVGKPRTCNLVSNYFDTPQLALLDLGISLRVRRMSGNWIQAINSTGKSLVGVHQRMEWEDIIAFDHPDFSKITEPALTRIFDEELLRNTLDSIFRIKLRRTEWQLAFDNGDQIELALEVGELVVAKMHEPISEIELELKKGNTGRLFDFALELQQSVPLELETVSKAQRGYTHYRPQPPTIVRAHPTRLQRDMSAHAALKQIAWECLTHLQGNQDMVLHGEDEEGVHQMRVALRRLRSALSVFRSVASRQSCAGIIEELRWITGVLGLARDLDVFATQTLPPMLQQLHTHPGLIQLNEKASQAKLQAYTEVRAALSSQRYNRLLLTLGAWLENECWREANAVECSVLNIAQAMLAKRHKQLRKHGRRLMHMHPEERHATRIAAKKLRYAAEFFASLYPEARSHNFLPALAELLDILGILNDIAVTESLIRCLIGSHPNHVLDESLHLITGWNACHVMHRMQSMESIWNRFAHQNPFWH